jgi:hypothetical protein
LDSQANSEPAILVDEIGLIAYPEDRKSNVEAGEDRSAIDSEALKPLSGKTRNHRHFGIHFALCESCFWIASLIITSHPRNLSSCPICLSKAITLLPLGYTLIDLMFNEGNHKFSLSKQLQKDRIRLKSTEQGKSIQKREI